MGSQRVLSSEINAPRLGCASPQGTPHQTSSGAGLSRRKAREPELRAAIVRTFALASGGGLALEHILRVSPAVRSAR